MAQSSGNKQKKSQDGWARRMTPKIMQGINFTVFMVAYRKASTKLC